MVLHLAAERHFREDVAQQSGIAHASRSHGGTEVARCARSLHTFCDITQQLRVHALIVSRPPPPKQERRGVPPLAETRVSAPLKVPPPRAQKKNLGAASGAARVDAGRGLKTRFKDKKKAKRGVKSLPRFFL